MSKNLVFAMFFGTIMVLGTGLQASGAEHPSEKPAKSEHPSEHPTKKKAEHPTKEHKHNKENPAEHPTESKKSGLSIEQVADSVRKYIAIDSATKGGYFMVWDKVKKKPLALKLDKIHEDRLSPIGDSTFFVCADFKATNGKTYDLDFFMKEGKDGRVRVTDTITVHKVKGKERYGWVKKGGKWMMSKK